MFYLRYPSAKLRRRKGRPNLTALGLAAGVGTVAIVVGAGRCPVEAARAVRPDGDRFLPSLSRAENEQMLMAFLGYERTLIL